MSDQSIQYPGPLHLGDRGPVAALQFMEGEGHD